MTLFTKNRITISLASLGLLFVSTMSNAQSLAITNATVHTVSEQGVLKNAVVVVEDGVITAINPATVNADTTIDAKGQHLTPGIIASMTKLGLVEVGAVARSRDAGDDKADITFDPGLAFNPKATNIPYSRKGGITSSVIAPSGGKTIFYGQTSVVNLTGEYASVTNANNAVFVQLGSKSKGSRAIGLQTLINALDDADKRLKKEAKTKAEKAAKKDKDKEKAKDKDKAEEDKEPSREELIYNALLQDQKPLVIDADRAPDLLHLIELKKRFNLNLIINSADEAIVIADQLAEADIPIIIDPMRNLPSTFDSMHSSLENAGKLVKAGVKVIMTEWDTHNMYLMRFHAGNAISYGMDREAALASMTANAAEAFNINAGTIEVGKPADLVLWNGDMFDVTGYVEKMWIGGKEYTTQSRHDKLRDRYMKKSDMPPAYVK
jgi:imidazolonepropionase-like amidohydrolase